MHKSRLGNVVIDCRTGDLDAAAGFWASALGCPAAVLDDPADANYETDDIETEVARLEKLGARRVAQVRHWWVMEAPTGQRFCVVRPQRADFETQAREWP
jgi:hypothetical protein